MHVNSNQGWTRIAALSVVALILIACVNAFPCYASHGDHMPKAGKKGTMTSTNPIVVMETTKGTIKLEIYKEDSPITSQNFLDLVQRGFYNGLTFHRYEPNFCIQGGDPRGTGSGGFIDPMTKRERTIPLEISPNHKHSEAGMLAMARSSDPNSASSQFYITLAPASWLDGQYAIFGKVVDGIGVVEALRKGDKMTKVTLAETPNKAGK
jgi:cyclophilin family peptidyl-prolyl cis-trans isomerase